MCYLIISAGPSLGLVYLCPLLSVSQNCNQGVGQPVAWLEKASTPKVLGNSLPCSWCTEGPKFLLAIDWKYLSSWKPHSSWGLQLIPKARAQLLATWPSHRAPSSVSQARPLEQSASKMDLTGRITEMAPTSAQPIAEKNTPQSWWTAVSLVWPGASQRHVDRPGWPRSHWAPHSALCEAPSPKPWSQFPRPGPRSRAGLQGCCSS